MHASDVDCPIALAQKGAVRLTVISGLKPVNSMAVSCKNFVTEVQSCANLNCCVCFNTISLFLCSSLILYFLFIESIYFLIDIVFKSIIQIRKLTKQLDTEMAMERERDLSRCIYQPKCF